LSAEFSPDDDNIVTGSSDGTARLWHVFFDTRKLIATAKAAAPRCLSVEQRAASFFFAGAAASVVHRDGKVALSDGRMEDLACRPTRREESCVAQPACFSPVK
jgi:hypothetical protein